MKNKLKKAIAELKKIGNFTPDSLSRFVALLNEQVNDTNNEIETSKKGRVKTDNSITYDRGSASGSNTPTINKPVGTITTAVLATAAGAYVDIVLSNSVIKADSFVNAQVNYSGTGDPEINNIAVIEGQATITLVNRGAVDALNAAAELRFVVH